jgi:hypothetical protein
MFDLGRFAADCRAAERSEWDPETLAEHPYELDRTMRLFEASNAALAGAR